MKTTLSRYRIFWIELDLGQNGGLFPARMTCRQQHGQRQGRDDGILVR
jgi:hypothetical protein